MTNLYEENLLSRAKFYSYSLAFIQVDANFVYPLFIL